MPFLILLCLLFVQAPLPALAKESPEQLIKQAQQKEEAGDYEGAQALYEEILKGHPEHEAALLGLGQVLYWQGNYKTSLETYHKLLDKNLENVKALIGISKVYLGLGNQKKAQEYLDKAKKLDPTNKELEALSPQMEKTTRITLHGGYVVKDLSYATDFQAEYQEIRIEKEKNYGFGVKTAYVNSFDLNGFDTQLAGHYYFKEKTRADLGIRFAPSVDILPQQGYSVGLAHTFWKVTPEIHYTFEDYTQADQHMVEPAIFFEPIANVSIGGGYEFRRLLFGNTRQEMHSGFGKIKVTPLDWLSFNGFYERRERGFEGGRAPSPYIRYSAHAAGGGIGLDFQASYSIHFDAYTEQRNNNENAATYQLALGAVF